MTKEEMMNAYYVNLDNKNYEEAQEKIKKAMKAGEKHIMLPGKNNADNFDWVATPYTIAKLIADGFDIDKIWDPYEYWSVEWGF